MLGIELYRRNIAFNKIALKRDKVDLRDEGGDADEEEAVGLAATRVVALLEVLGASAAATGAPTAAEAQAHQRRDQNEDQADEHHQRHESVVSDQRTPLVLQVRNSHSPVALIRHDTCGQRDNSISEHCHTYRRHAKI